MLLVSPTAAIGSDVVFLCSIPGIYIALILLDFLVFTFIFLPCPYDWSLVAWVDGEPD